MDDGFRLELKGLRGYGESIMSATLVLGGIALAIFADLGPFIFLAGLAACLGAFVLAWIWLGGESWIVRDGRLIVERRLMGFDMGRTLTYSAKSIGFVSVEHKPLMDEAFGITFDLTQRLGIFTGPVVLHLTDGELVRIGEGLTYDDQNVLQSARELAAALGVEFRATL